MSDTAWLCVVLVLGVLLAITAYMLLLAINRVTFLYEDLDAAKDVEHTKCMAAVMKFVGDEFAAQVLSVAAEDYAGVEAQPDIDRIKRLLYRPGGPPVPTIWLHERADKLRIMMTPELVDAIEHVEGMNYNEVAL